MPHRGPSFPLQLLPPPVLYAACFGVGLLADRLLPWSPAWMHGAPVRWLGWLIVLAATVLGLSSAGLFLLRRTTVIPHRRPSRLVTDGPYALSRNPMYVALTAAYGGVCLLIGRAWPLLLLVVAVTVMHRVIIPSEERRLADTFGAAYDTYCRRVRRWL